MRGTPISQRIMPFISNIRVVAFDAVTRRAANRSRPPLFGGDKKAGLTRSIPSAVWRVSYSAAPTRADFDLRARAISRSLRNSSRSVRSIRTV